MGSPIKLLLIAVLFNANLAWAESKPAPWYQVELFVFSQNQENLSAESWDENIYPQTRPGAVNIYGNSGKKAGIITLSAADRQIPIAKSLMKRNGYRQLFHQVWQQPIQGKREARPIRIRGGEAMNDQLYELEGDISIDIARYLHLRTNLFFNLRKPAGWQSSPTIDVAAEPPTASLAVGSITDAVENLDNSVAADQPISIDLSEIRDPEILSVQMKQGRRMRGDQIHYLDHPMFGLFIKMTRIEGPGAANEQPKTQDDATVSLLSDVPARNPTKVVQTSSEDAIISSTPIASAIETTTTTTTTGNTGVQQ
ncbi:MAG: peptidoglycan binding protein CsiV [Motiliproteus sp.]|nr:peptidoglycan binding protein CsiV [Motiliproteus sp.]MCW9051510.1 peptidoglycan binding protein CsiV [Motiliproteus sp.]